MLCNLFQSPPGDRFGLEHAHKLIVIKPIPSLSKTRGAKNLISVKSFGTRNCKVWENNQHHEGTISHKTFSTASVSCTSLGQGLRRWFVQPWGWSIVQRGSPRWCLSWFLAPSLNPHGALCESLPQRQTPCLLNLAHGLQMSRQALNPSHPYPPANWSFQCKHILGPDVKLKHCTARSLVFISPSKAYISLGEQDRHVWKAKGCISQR